MDTWVWILIAVAVVLVVVGVGAWMWSSRRRRDGLRDRFGSEYDRTVDKAGKRRTAERDLRDRVSRHDELELHELTPAARERFEHQWNDLQSGFVDRPVVAVAHADQLVSEVMQERGYPVDDFEAQSDLISVDHPDIVANYRRGHEIYRRTVDGSASTEDLRQAVVSYRSLFEELVHDGGEQPATA